MIRNQNIEAIKKLVAK